MSTYSFKIAGLDAEDDRVVLAEDALLSEALATYRHQRQRELQTLGTRVPPLGVLLTGLTTSLGQVAERADAVHYAGYGAPLYNALERLQSQLLLHAANSLLVAGHVNRLRGGE